MLENWAVTTFRIIAYTMMVTKCNVILDLNLLLYWSNIFVDVFGYTLNIFRVNVQKSKKTRLLIAYRYKLII